MVFSSLIFLFVFFALNLAVYFTVPKRFRNQVLLVFSLVFYAWGGPKYLLLLVGETLISWWCALFISKHDEPSKKKLGIVLECVALLGLLAYFKYTRFLVGNVAAIFNAPEIIPEIFLPIGISFYTFQLISYVCDVYWGKVEAQPVFWKLLLYSSLFYQCIAGPIVRYSTVADDIDHRKVTSLDVYAGMRRFCIGLAKKAVLANSCASVADTLLPMGTEGLFLQSTAGCWLGMLFYMLQIYLDFSAYSDMAIGMGRMVGFRFLENFNYPYQCTSIQDFWRRWHISLSSFFRDYVYIPLGGSRCSKLKYVRNMTVVWFLTGLWHGASWNYIFWGLFFLVFLLLEKFAIGGFLKNHKGIGHVYALVVVFFGWVLFKFENFNELGWVLTCMFGQAGTGLVGLEVQTLFLQNVFLLAFSIVACTVAGKKLHLALGRLAKQSPAFLRIYGITEALTPVFCLLVSVIALAGASYNPFIYFQF